MSKLRWSQFFWADWQSDPALNLCGLAARGLWMALLCLAAQGEPYGHVTIKGRVPTTDELFDLTAPRGTKRRDWNLWMAELERHGVAQRDHSGAVHCPQMSRSGAVAMARMDAANSRWKAQENSQTNADLHMQKPKNRPDLHMQSTRFAYTEPEPESESEKNPPVAPLGRGARGRSRAEPGGRKPSRNGFIDIAIDMIEEDGNGQGETDDGGADEGGARVVDITRHLGGRKPPT